MEIMTGGDTAFIFRIFQTGIQPAKRESRPALFRLTFYLPIAF
jgi:hypothetical protein